MLLSLLQPQFSYCETDNIMTKKVFNANANEKKSWVAILIPGKVSFKTKVVTRDKKGRKKSRNNKRKIFLNKSNLNIHIQKCSHFS